MSWFELIGWVGTTSYLANHAYISLKNDWIAKLYYSGNLLAAVCLLVSSLVIASYQAVVINGFWAVVSFLLLAGFDMQKVPVRQSHFWVVISLLWAVIIYQFFTLYAKYLDMLGWSSSFVFCGAYLLFTAKKMQQRSYFIWNFYAAVALLPQLWLDQNWPAFALEICWAFISMIGAVRYQPEVHLID